MSPSGNQAKKLPEKSNVKLSLTRAQIKEKFEQTLTYARLALSGKPLITIREEGDGAVALTEGYFGSKTSVTGLRFEDLPKAVAHRLISEDAAMEAFRFMMKKKIMMPANDE